jgi:hypothetical protein
LASSRAFFSFSSNTLSLNSSANLKSFFSNAFAISFWTSSAWKKEKKKKI